MGAKRSIACPQFWHTRSARISIEAARRQHTAGLQREPAAAQPPAATTPPDSTSLIAIKTVKAAYPSAAADEKLQGEVILKIVVSETGDVESAEIVSGHPVLAKAAVDAAKKWKFKPYFKNGKPVKASVNLPFDFAFSGNVLLNQEAPKHDASRGKDAASTGVPGRVRVSQGVTAGLILRKVNPMYPEEARKRRIQGTVVLAAVIGKDGRIKNLHVVSGDPMLAQSALDTVQEWRYKPYFLLGQPVEVDTTIQGNFRLSGG